MSEAHPEQLPQGVDLGQVLPGAPPALTLTQRRHAEGAIRDLENACQKLVYVFGFTHAVQRTAPLQAMVETLNKLIEAPVRDTGKGRKVSSVEKAEDPSDPRSTEEKAADERELLAAAAAAADSVLRPVEGAAL